MVWISTWRQQGVFVSAFPFLGVVLVQQFFQEDLEAHQEEEEVPLPLARNKPPYPSSHCLITSCCRTA